MDDEQRNMPSFLEMKGFRLVPFVSLVTSVAVVGTALYTRFSSEVQKMPTQMRFFTLLTRCFGAAGITFSVSWVGLSLYDSARQRRILLKNQQLFQEHRRKYIQED
eukprot:RCo032270